MEENEKDIEKIGGLACLFTTEVNFTPLQTWSSGSVQGCYVRAMGRVDDELLHGNDFCRKLQGSSSNGILVAQA